MRHRIPILRLALPALALLIGVGAATAQAQQPAKDLVPIKGTVTGAGDSFLISFDPPIVSSRFTGTGQMEVLGQQFAVTMVGHIFVTLGMDGTPLSSDQIGVVIYPEGSAVFIRGSGGPPRPSTKEGYLVFETTFTCVGGRGMFLGASGSGTSTAEMEIATGKQTFSAVGYVVMPNAKKS